MDGLRVPRWWYIRLSALVLVLVLAACGTPQTPLVEITPTPYYTPTTTPEPTPTLMPTPLPTLSPGTPTPTLRPLASPTPTLIPTPTATPLPPVGTPKRLRIPAIKVDAVVESVGLTPDGAMGVPSNYENTAWYNLGPKPGEPGNAVIDGHVDSQTGAAVFWNLRKLRPGDLVIVVGDDGAERKFVVTALVSYKRAEAPLQQIFGPAPGVHLNLITCDQNSVFNRQQGGYASNLVVYTDAVP